MSLGSSGVQPPAPIRYSGLNVSSSMMDLPVPIFWGQRRLTTNAIWYGDFQQHPISGKGKGGGAKGQQAYDYTAATIQGLCEGPIDSIARAWASGSTTTTTTLSQLNMTLFTGTASQSPWSWITSNFPTQARSYAYTAYLACPNQDLGEAATIPDNAFETIRSNGFAYTHTTNGWIDPNSHTQYPAIDVLLSDCAQDLLTNPQYGALMAAGDLGDMTQWASYMQAQGLFYSPLLNRLEKANDVLDRWAQLSNSWIYWAGTQLQFVPLGDQGMTANGATYTPHNDVAYDLGPGDFLTDGGGPPVKVNRKDPADCFSRTILNITDRTLGYVSNPLEYKDQTLIDAAGIGMRDNENIQADEICDPLVGKIVVQLLGKRSAYIRATFEFKTSYRYIRALPGTILTLTEPNIGLGQFRVRVKTVAEDEKGNLNFTCEEFPGVVGKYLPPNAVPIGSQSALPNLFADPGPVNTPAIVEPDPTYHGGSKLLIAASGGSNWGGCEVFISFDGTNYQNAGSISAPAPQGVLTASLAAHVDPDTSDTLAVNCAESLTTPLPVSHADADAYRSLALIQHQPSIAGGVATVGLGELVSFGTITSTGTYTANLTYLRRGAYGTLVNSHSVGDQFTVLDTLGKLGTTLEYTLPSQYVGQPIYLKFASFNAFGNAAEDLSTVQEYKYTPTGAGIPPPLSLGDLALLDDITAAQMNVGVGTNVLVDSTFALGSDFYRAYSDLRVGQATVNTTAGNLRYLENDYQSGDQYLGLLSDNMFDTFPVTPGEPIELSAFVGAVGSSVSTVSIYAVWYDLNFSNLQNATPPVNPTLLQTLSSFPAGAGELTTWEQIGKHLYADSDSRSVRVGLAVITNTGVSSGAKLRMMQPFTARSLSGNVDNGAPLSKWNIGIGIPGATVGATAGTDLKDSSGTVLGDTDVKNSAITLNANGTVTGGPAGQVTLPGLGGGTIATKNLFIQGATPSSGMVSGDVWIKNNVTPNQIFQYDQSSTTWVKASPTLAAEITYASSATIESLKPAEAGANVTGSHTAAAITFQGPLATSAYTISGSVPGSASTYDQLVYTGSTYPQLYYWQSGWQTAASWGSEIGVNLRSTVHGVQGDPDVITGQGTSAAIFGQQAWATYGDLKPGLNVTQGLAGVRDVPAILSSSSSSSVTTTSHNYYVPGTTRTPSGTTISGLAADTPYHTFYNTGGTWFAATDSMILTNSDYFNSTSSKVYAGTQRTQLGGGGFTPAPTPPAGGGGASASFSRYYYYA